MRSLGPSSALEWGAGDGGPGPGKPGPAFPGASKGPSGPIGQGAIKGCGAIFPSASSTWGGSSTTLSVNPSKEHAVARVPRSFALFGSGPRTADTSSPSKAGPTPSSVAPTATWDPRVSAVTRNAIASTPFPGTTCVHALMRQAPVSRGIEASLK